MRSKSGEYFGLLDPNGNITEAWIDLPGERPIIVQKYNPMFGNGKPQIEVITRRFRRDALQLTKEQFASRDVVLGLFTNNNEEDEMSSNEIIESARGGDPKAVEEVLNQEIARALKRALWVAEKKDEFAAIPVIQDLQTKYGGVAVGKGDTTLTEKDGKSVKLSKTEKVDDRVWRAILKKASKIGAVVKSSGNRAELIIRKKEVEVFAKAAKAVNGITVEA